MTSDNEDERGYAMKIRYRTAAGTESRAYTDLDYTLHWEPTDGEVITATDKYTDEPVTVRWVDDYGDGGEWVELSGP